MFPAGRFSSSIPRAIRPVGALMPHHSGDSPIFCFGWTFGALLLPAARGSGHLSVPAMGHSSKESKLGWFLYGGIVLFVLLSVPSLINADVNDQENWQSFPLSSASLYGVFL